MEMKDLYIENHKIQRKQINGKTYVQGLEGSLAIIKVYFCLI